MKFVYFSFVFASIIAMGRGLTLTQNAKILAARVACAQSTKVDPVLVQTVRVDDYSVDDTKLKRYALCVYQALGLLNPNTTINTDVGLTWLQATTDPAKYTADTTTCNKKWALTKACKLWDILKCYDGLYPGDIHVL